MGKELFDTLSIIVIGKELCDTLSSI